MNLKIHDPQKGLCSTCRHSHIYKGDSETIVRCGQIAESGYDRIGMVVTDCNKYDFKGMPSLSDMRRTAWILESDESKRQIGFVSNKEWRKAHKHDDVIDEF